MTLPSVNNMKLRLRNKRWKDISITEVKYFKNNGGGKQFSFAYLHYPGNVMSQEPKTWWENMVYDESEVGHLIHRYQLFLKVVRTDWKSRSYAISV